MYNPTMNDVSTQISGEGAELLDMKLVSADSHIVEPPNCYTDYIDPAWRDRAPRIRRTDSGADYFEVPGMPRKVTLGLTAAGRMTAHGQKQIDAAKADGRWDAAYAPMRTASVESLPPDLRAAIDAHAIHVAILLLRPAHIGDPLSIW